MVESWIPVVYTNTFAIIVLVILMYDSTRRKSRSTSSEQLIFLCMLILAIVMLVVDASTFILEEVQLPWARSANLVATTIFYALNPLMSLLYLVYCELQIGSSQAQIKAHLPFYMLPVAINLVLTLASSPYGLLFSLSEDNIYQRGPFFPLAFVLSYSLLLVAVVRLLRYYHGLLKDVNSTPNDFNRHVVKALLFFPIPQVIGSIIQIFTINITVAWLALVISILIIFIYVQNTEIYTDYLTGLPNKRRFEQYLHQALTPGEDNDIQIIIFDVNNFKYINDNYGHQTGDKALRAVAAALQSVYEKDKLIARYGGDEFVVVGSFHEPELIQTSIDNCNSLLADYCHSNKLVYQLSICGGNSKPAGYYNNNSDELLAAADADLYDHKSKSKRRASDRR